MVLTGIERIVLLDFIHRTRRWIKSKSTIRSILIHHRQNPTKIIDVNRIEDNRHPKHFLDYRSILKPGRLLNELPDGETETDHLFMGIGGSFLGDKAAGEWSWPLTSIKCRGQIMSGAIPPLPNTPSWRARSVKAQGQIYLLPLTSINTWPDCFRRRGVFFSPCCTKRWAASSSLAN
jgi:hypothetical protein